MEDEIIRLAEILGDSSSHIIAEYTRWYFINAIVWTFGWAALAIGCALKVETDVDVVEQQIAKYVVILLCLFGAATCVTNIFSPEAYAIHSRIMDITHS